MKQVWASMKHPSSKAVFAYWNEQRRGRPAPDRSDIDPGAIRHALGDTFMLAADFGGRLRFRLAGTRTCALFCRELKGEDFGEVWSEHSRQPIEDLLAAVTHEGAAAVAGATGRTEDGEATDLEMLVLPLAHRDNTRVRILGVLAPASPPYWLGDRALAEIDMTTLRYLGAAPGSDGATLQPALDDVRVRHGFVVYSGGRAISPGQNGITRR
jgi:hypothetical protein